MTIVTRTTHSFDFLGAPDFGTSERDLAFMDSWGKRTILLCLPTWVLELGSPALTVCFRFEAEVRAKLRVPASSLVFDGPGGSGPGGRDSLADRAPLDSERTALALSGMRGQTQVLQLRGSPVAVKEVKDGEARECDLVAI